MGKLAALLLLATTLSCLAQPKITYYDLKYSFDFNEKKLFGTAAIKVDVQAKDTLHLLLYRLIKVKSITDAEGKAIPFTQTVKAFDDWEQFQVNSIQVTPPTSLKTMVIEYEGYMKGYTETGMLYTKDQVDTTFTLLRPDCFAYPEAGVANWDKYSNQETNYFDYKISVTVPNNLKVINGGTLVSATKEKDLTTYVYTNRKPAWRIDIAIGKYRSFEDKDFIIHYFPEDSSQIKSVAENVKKAYGLYEKWFGEKNKVRYAIIEIPDQWGSQTDVTSILQEASAIKDGKQMYELYHEISHIWNLTPLDHSPSRLESEGLAVFLQSLVTEKLHNTPGALDRAAERNTQRLMKAFEKDPKKGTIPISEYGPNQLTDLSYTKGMLFFYALYQKMGEEKFMRAIRDYYTRYRSKGATLKEFSTSMAKSLPGTGPMIENWLFSNKPLEELLKK